MSGRPLQFCSSLVLDIRCLTGMWDHLFHFTKNIAEVAKMADELSLFDLASVKLTDAQKLTGEAHELLKEDLEKVRREKAAFEELTQTLNEVHFGSTVKLAERW